MERSCYGTSRPGKSGMVLKHSSPVTSLAFSPDSRSLAATGFRNDWSLVLWDLKTGDHSSFPESGRGPISALAFSPDGKLLASTSFIDSHVRIWDTALRRLCRVLSAHSHSVNSVAFSPDGSLLATAGNDGTIRLWAVATGRAARQRWIARRHASGASCFRRMAERSFWQPKTTTI